MKDLWNNPFNETESQNSDENSWAVSYGDVITLLLVFFILLTSSAQMSAAKFEKLQKMFKGETEEFDSLEKLKKELEKILKKRGLSEFVNIKETDDGVMVIIKNELLFGSGSSEIALKNQKKLTPLLNSLHELPKIYRFTVEGHTDNAPIKSKTYPSNWHLSTARALSLLNLFLKNNFSDDRLRVEGFADQKPWVPNEDKNGKPIEENRRKNRRVVIRIY